MRHHESLRSEGARAERERCLSRRLEVAREERRGSLRRRQPEHETAVVDRPAPVGVRGMDHVEGSSPARDAVTRAHPPHGDSPVAREVDHVPHPGIVLGARGDPHLSHVEILEDRRRAADVIGMAVGEGEDRDPAAAAGEDRRHDETLSGVEASGLSGPGVDEDGLTPEPQQHRKSLPDVQDLEARRAAIAGGRAEVQGDRDEGERGRDPPSCAAPGKNDRRRDERRVEDDEPGGGRGDAEVASRDRRRPPRDRNEGVDGGVRERHRARAEARKLAEHQHRGARGQAHRAQHARGDVRGQRHGGGTPERDREAGRGGEVRARRDTEPLRQESRPRKDARDRRPQGEQSRGREHAQLEAQVHRERRDRGDQERRGQRERGEAVDLAAGGSGEERDEDHRPRAEHGRSPPDERGEGRDRKRRRHREGDGARARAPEEGDEEHDRERGVQTADGEEMHEAGVAQHAIGVLVGEPSIPQHHRSENTPGSAIGTEGAVEGGPRRGAQIVDRPPPRLRPPFFEPDQACALHGARRVEPLRPQLPARRVLAPSRTARGCAEARPDADPVAVAERIQAHRVVAPRLGHHEPDGQRGTSAVVEPDAHPPLAPRAALRGSEHDGGHVELRRARCRKPCVESFYARIPRDALRGCTGSRRGERDERHRETRRAAEQERRQERRDRCSRGEPRGESSARGRSGEERAGDRDERGWWGRTRHGASGRRDAGDSSRSSMKATARRAGGRKPRGVDP